MEGIDQWIEISPLLPERRGSPLCGVADCLFASLPARSIEAGVGWLLVSCRRLVDKHLFACFFFIAQWASSGLLRLIYHLKSFGVWAVFAFENLFDQTWLRKGLRSSKVEDTPYPRSFVLAFNINEFCMMPNSNSQFVRGDPDTTTSSLKMVRNHWNCLESELCFA